MTWGAYTTVDPLASEGDVPAPARNVRADLWFSVQTLALLQYEVERARRKFPTNRPLLIACAEELGELAKALAHGDREKAIAEAVQLASTALRIAEEGDSTFALLTPDERKP